jgi:hypothetical protein
LLLFGKMPVLPGTGIGIFSGRHIPWPQSRWKQRRHKTIGSHFLLRLAVRLRSQRGSNTIYTRQRNDFFSIGDKTFPASRYQGEYRHKRSFGLISDDNDQEKESNNDG